MEKIYDLGTIRSNFSGLQLMINESANKTKIINGITKSKFCRHKELPLVDCLNHLLKQGALSSPCFLCTEEKRDLYAIVRSNANIGELICEFTDKTINIVSSDNLKNIKKVFTTVFFIRPTKDLTISDPKFVDYVGGLLFSAHLVKKNFPKNTYKIRLYTTNVLLDLFPSDELKREATIIRKSMPSWDFNYMQNSDRLRIRVDDTLYNNLWKFMLNILLCEIIELYMYDCGDYTNKGTFGTVMRYVPFFSKDDEALEEIHVRDLDETFGNVVDKFWIDFWKQTNFNNYALSLYDANHLIEYRPLILGKPFMPSFALSGGKPIKGLDKSKRKEIFNDIEKLCDLDIVNNNCGYGVDEVFNSHALYKHLSKSYISFNIQKFGWSLISTGKASKSLDMLCNFSDLSLEYIYLFALYYQLYNAEKVGKDKLEKFIQLMNTIDNAFCYEPNPRESYSYDNLKFIYETFKEDFKNIKVDVKVILYLLYANDFAQTFIKLTNKLTENLVEKYEEQPDSYTLLSELHIGEIPEYDTNVIDLNLVKHGNIDMFLHINFDYFLKHVPNIKCLKEYNVPPTIKNYLSLIELGGITYIILNLFTKEKEIFHCVDLHDNNYVIKLTEHAFKNIVMTEEIKGNLSEIPNIQRLIKLGEFQTKKLIKLQYSINQYIEGTVLSEMGFITLDFLMSIIDQILEIIRRFKQAKLLFVDINETNIIIAPNNKIYLIDLEHVAAYGTTINQFGKYNNLDILLESTYKSVTLNSDMIIFDERLDLYCLTRVMDHILTDQIRDSDKESPLYKLLSNFIESRKKEVYKITITPQKAEKEKDAIKRGIRITIDTIKSSPYLKLDDYKDEIAVIKQRGKEVIKM